MKYAKPKEGLFTALLDIGNGWIKVTVEKKNMNTWKGNVKITSKHMEQFVDLLSDEYATQTKAKKACERVIDEINKATYYALENVE